ncbi:MAG: DUF4440 domain-containing protein [Candidatus Promineifilaceae bacterium]|jgi:hypothetical protein
MTFRLNLEEKATLQRLEESLWNYEKRSDVAYMDHVLAEDFFEFGRSGRVYQWDDTISGEVYAFEALFPLPDFEARLLSRDVAQVTYNSQVMYEDGILLKSRRSSIWLRKPDSPEGWKLVFHQGTPYH